MISNSNLKIPHYLIVYKFNLKIKESQTFILFFIILISLHIIHRVTRPTATPYVVLLYLVGPPTTYIHIHSRTHLASCVCSLLSSSITFVSFLPPLPPLLLPIRLIAHQQQRECVARKWRLEGHTEPGTTTTSCVHGGGGGNNSARTSSSSSTWWWFID